MSNTLIFYEKNNAIVSAGFNERTMVAFRVEETNDPYKVGNIYVGRVCKIILHMKAAYVDIGMKVPCYMELIDGFNYITDMEHPDGELHVGDCLLVQILKDAVRNKPVTVTPEVSITDKNFFIKYSKNTGMGFSSKIKDAEFKKRIKARYSKIVPSGYYIICRTNAELADDSELDSEFENNTMLLQKIVDKSATRTAKSLIYECEPEYLSMLRDSNNICYDKIVTDSPDVYIKLKDYLKGRGEDNGEKLSFYSDKVLSLEALYDMKKNISELIGERVWLKSGAHIVIEQTEALVSIDVNSSKASTKKQNFKEGFMKINLEAAEEIFRQLELRELSGMILVDFINMKGIDSEILFRKVVEIGKKYKNIQVLDITKLGLVEMTRNRIHQPVKEQIKRFKLLEN